MPLPHYTQLQMTGSPGGPGSQPHEAVYTNLFEISFVLPVILQAQGRDPLLLLQQAKNFTLDTVVKEISTSKQKFKNSSRVFLNAGVEDSTVEFTINFNVNVNEQGAMETFNTMKAWYDLGWNSQNGYMHYKADTIGTVIVNHHDKKGVVLQRYIFQNAQVTSVSVPELDWSGVGIWENCAVKFVADYWIEEKIDQEFVIAPPIVSGY